MRMEAYQECIDPSCRLRYPINEFRIACDRGHALDVKYSSRPDSSLKDVFYARRNHGNNIYNESGVWRFRDLINFAGIDTEDYEECRRYLASLDGAEGRLSKPFKMSRVAEYVGMDKDCLFLQPEGYNPSGSFKDNGMATALTHAKMLNVRKIVCASTGNTSASAAMYASNEGMGCEVYVPRGEIAVGKLGQALQFGAQVVEVDGNFDDALQIMLNEAKRSNAYVVNSVNPFRLEGQKTIVYRALEYLDWNPPDWLVYPGGALGNTSSAGKCLMELYEWGWIKKVPRLAIVNAEGANTLYTLYNGRFSERVLRWNKGKVDMELIEEYYAYMDKQNIRPRTEATAIQIGKPANLLKGLRALEFTDGVVEQVRDEDMYDGMAVVGLNGFDCELASGAVPAGIKKLREMEIIKRDDVVVGILTGRQKDPNLVIRYHTDSSRRFAVVPRSYNKR
ncbi:MAG: pyridoxal-phosphate dependent enzyme [Candidatus Nitrosocaldus sp.]|nr:pyridoxal-phosphate dependent enzyme [Candidatus Nitrosocaldus sp.]MDW8275554.1 pyridoxal-phosphate dependent enzyme [Candidatus Nitrosocaldus sp.]